MLATNEEVTSLTAAIDHIDTEFTHLFRRRSQLRTRLNEIRSATRHLPAEIMTEIFRLSACNLNIREPESHYFVDFWCLLDIGSVCSQWRRIAWSASSLWTTCLLTTAFARNERITMAPSHLISQVLKNCQPHNRRLSARVELDDPHDRDEKLEVLFSQGHRQLSSLRFFATTWGLKDSWNQVSRHFETTTGFPNLVELWLNLPDDVNITYPLFRAPVPIPIHYVRRERDFIPWAIPIFQLTVLRFDAVPVDQCIHLLLQAPNLVEFLCINSNALVEDIYDESTLLLPMEEQPKSLHNIKKFQFEVQEEYWNRFILSSIRLPNLERLFWSFHDFDLDNPEDRTLCEGFLLPFNTTLLTLDQEPFEGGTPIHATSPIEVVQFNSVETLYILTATFVEFITWVKKLTLFENANDNPLPNLRSLYINVGTSYYREESYEENRAENLDTLRRFLSSRRNRPRGDDGQEDDIVCEEYWKCHTRLERITVKSHVSNGPVWTEPQMELLNEFEDGGLILELFESHYY